MRRSILPALAGLLLALATIAPSKAQERPEVAAVSALATDYQLTNADGDRVCAISLKTNPVAGGSFAVTFDKAACAETIAFSSEVQSWTPAAGGTIQLLGAQGRLVIEFTEGIGGNWEGLRENDGVYFLNNPKLADPSQQAQPADQVGTWEVARTAGKTICRFKLSDTQAEDGSFRMELEPGCDPALARFAPTLWRIERGDLVVMSVKGDRLRFALQEEGGWAKVPEGNRPLYLTRP